jgi:hypothetical protein
MMERRTSGALSVAAYHYSSDVDVSYDGLLHLQKRATILQGAE